MDRWGGLSPWIVNTDMLSRFGGDEHSKSLCRRIAEGEPELQTVLEMEGESLDITFYQQGAFGQGSDPLTTAFKELYPTESEQGEAEWGDCRGRDKFTQHILIETLLCARDSLLLRSGQPRPLLSGNLKFNEFWLMHSKNTGGAGIIRSEVSGKQHILMVLESHHAEGR